MLLVSDEDDISGTTHQVQEIKVIEKPQDDQDKDNSPAADTGAEASSPAEQAEGGTESSATLPG